MSGGVIDPVYYGEIGLFLPDEVKKRDYVWSAGDPLGHLFMLLYPVMKVNGKLKQPNQGRMTEGTGHSGVKLWITSPFVLELSGMLLIY